jgi:RHS repeat-associated protein
VIKSAVTSGTTHFHYDRAGHLIAESDGSGNVQREYVFLGDTPVAFVTPTGGIDIIHADHLGTPQKMTDATQAVVWDGGASDPFMMSALPTTPAMGLRFPGQYYDGETGLHYNYFRDYDPSLGRYTESDPIGLGGGINTYAYVGGNPLKYADPSGRMIPSFAGGGTLAGLAELGGTGELAEAMLAAAPEVTAAALLGGAALWALDKLLTNQPCDTPYYNSGGGGDSSDAGKPTPGASNPSPSASQPSPGASNPGPSAGDPTPADDNGQQGAKKPNPRAGTEEQALQDIVSDITSDGHTAISNDDADALMDLAKGIGKGVRDDRGTDHFVNGDHIHIQGISPKHIEVQ